MQDFHHNRARALLESAEELFTKQDVDNAVAAMADTLNARYNQPDSEEFPLVLGVMGGAVVFTGNLLPQLTFPLEFDYIHVSRYGDEDKGGEVVWKVVPRSNVSGRTVIVLDDILDEGETLAHVKQRLLDMGAKEVILAVFADKAIGKAKPVKADIVGITLPIVKHSYLGTDAHELPRVLTESGFTFAHTTVEQAVDAAVPAARG